MKQSDETKKCKYLSLLFLVLSYIVLYGPLTYYLITGIIIAHTATKVVLTLLAATALILMIICFIQKHRLRSPLWLMIIGIFFAVENILPLVIMVAAGTIIDEFCLTPLHKLYKNKATINKEIDKR